MPMPLAANTASGDTEYLAVTGCLADNTLYMGGYTMAADVLGGRTPPLPVLTAIDLKQNTYFYRRSFQLQYSDFQTISALRVSPDCKNLAIHGTSLNNAREAVGSVSYIVVVYANDGSYVTPMIRIVHNVAVLGEHTVLHDGMYFDSYGRVYMAFNHMATTGRNSDNGLITNYAGKALIGGFDSLKKTMMFYKEQKTLFGQSAAFAYKDFGINGVNVYLGGSVDYCRTTAPTQAKCWALAFSRIRPDGSASGTWQLHLAAPWTDESNTPFVDHISIDNNQLFGTTRCIDPTKSGSQMYVFMINLDANGDLTNGGLKFKQIDPAKVPGNSFITGMMDTLRGNVMNFVYLRNDMTMIYEEVDFTKTKTDGSRFFKSVNAKATWFQGARKHGQDGVDLYDAWTAASAQGIGNNQFGVDAGLVISSQDNEICKSADLYTRGDEAYNMPDEAFKLLNNFQDFQTQTLPVAYKIEEGLLYSTFSLNRNYLVSDSWCSNYNNKATAISGGKQLTDICGWWNGNTLTYPFDPIKITSPGGCTDTGLIWDYNVDVKSSVLSPDYFKLTMDDTENVIRLTPLPGPNIVGTFNITVTATEPSLQSSFIWNITVVIQPCLQPTIFPPTLLDQFYTVTTPYASYVIPSFTYSDPLCSGHEEFTNVVTPVNNWISGISDNGGKGSLVGWQTNIETKVGVYQIAINNFIGCKRTTVTYKLNVLTQCLVTPITIDSKGIIFVQPIALKQYVYQQQTTLSWSATDVTYSSATGEPLNCGPINFILTDGFDNPIDAAVFTAASLNPLSMATQTDDPAKINIYPLKIKAYFVNYPTNIAVKPFNIQIADICETPTGSAPFVADQTYTISRPKQSITFPTFNYLPSYCPFTLSYKVTPDPSGIDSNAIVFTDLTNLYEFFSDNLKMAGVYKITTTAVTPNGQISPLTFSFNVEFIDPCVQAILTISPNVVSNNPILYRILDPAHVETFLDSLVIQSEKTAQCPDIQFSITNKDGTPIDPAVWTWNPISQTFQTQTNDIKYYNNGIPSPFKLSAKYTGAKYPIAGSIDFSVILEDPCKKPYSVTASSQTDPSPNFYTGTNPGISVVLKPFVSDPNFCEFIYTCDFVSGPRLDLCDVLVKNSQSQITSQGLFDIKTGSYSFFTSDMVNFPPGQYIMAVTGTVGDKSAKQFVTITLVDPCPTAQITLQPSPFVDAKYILRDPAQSQNWLLSTIAKVNTLVDCGPWSVEFFYDNIAKTPISSVTIFSDTRNPSNMFTTVYNENINDVGVYPIKYRVFPSKYPVNSIESPKPFNITIVDPCSPPKSLTAPILKDQVYTITDVASSYQIPEFVVSPIWCNIAYTYTIVGPAGAKAVAFDSDPADRIFTFSNLQDLLLAGKNFTNYTITVQAESGNTATMKKTSNFNLTLKNPCIDPKYLSIDPVPMPTGLTYELYEFNITGFKWNHDPFVVKTVPIMHSLCGNLVYNCTWEGALINPAVAPLSQLTNFSASPVSYDTSTRTFNIYAEDRALIGMRKFACIARFQDYQTTVSTVSAGLIEIIDPCLNPNEIQVFEQTNPPPYYYTGLINIFSLNAFQTWPPNCLFTDYECSMVSGARLDLCDIIDAGTEGDFTPRTGSYTFKSIDMVNYPPGDYIFRITGKSGLNSDFVDITMTLVDPCPTTKLTLLQSPFIDQTYYLRDPVMIQAWLYSSLITKETPADCGPYQIDFFNDDVFQTPLDTTTFLNNLAGPNKFTTLYTEDLSKVGVYPIKYRIRLQNYPLRVFEAPFPFKITIIDPCDQPKGLYPAKLEDQEYTVTNITDTYQIPPFTADPAWCDITYSYIIVNPEGVKAVTFNADQKNRTFTFSNLQDLFLAGKNFTNYTITVQANTGVVVPVFNTSDFILTLRNPCIDPALVKLTVAPLSNHTYILHYFNLTGYEWTHPPFQVITLPFQHSFCGLVVAESTFESSSIDNTTRPMSYDQKTRTFNFYSEQRSLIGTRTYSMLAKLENYSTTASDIQFGTITIIDPCLSPTQITPTNQTSPPAYYYTGQIVKFTMNPFQTWPPGCAFTYECTKVDGPDPDIQCEMDTSVGLWKMELVGNESAGTFTFSTTNMQKYSPGIYKFTITGSIGTKNPITAKQFFFLQLIDPCPRAQLTLVDYPLRVIDYYLGENQLNRLLNLQKMVKLSTPVDCSRIFIEIKQVFDNSIGNLDTKMFDLIQNPGDERFVVKKTEDIAKIGQYTFYVDIWPTNYQDNHIKGDPFVVNIKSPCTPEYLDMVQKWPLLCPKPVPAKIQIDILPEWMLNLKDQVTYVGESLEYNLGEPVSIYGDRMDVKIEYNFYQKKFMQYDRAFNSHEVVGLMMEESDVGYYTIIIKANYTDKFGKQVKFSAQFIQTILPCRFNCYVASLIKRKDVLHYIEEWDHGIRYSAEPEPYDPTLPQPFVESLSPTGVLTVGWTHQMIPFTDYVEIQRRKVAIRSANATLHLDKGVGAPKKLEKRRNLYDSWFIDKAGALEEKIQIFDGIEVNITVKDDPERQLNYTWHIQGFDENFIYFKFDFESPETASEYSNFDQIKITFWETKYFQNNQGKQVGYGASLEWGMYRQVSQETADTLDSLFDFFMALVCIVMVIVLLLLFCGGRLIPTWMFLNSLSLIAHLPLLGVMMPNSLHYFLLKWLKVFTLSNYQLHYQMEIWRKPLSVKNYNKAIDEDSPYNVLLNDCGYKHAYARNLLIFFVLGAFIFFMWLICIVRVYILKKYYPRYFEREKDCIGWCRKTKGFKKASSIGEKVKRQKGYKFLMLVACRMEKDKKQNLGWELWWANFGLRFMYMVFFELILSVLINLTIVDFDMSDSFLLWLTDYFVLMLIVMGVTGLAYLFIRGGPYLEHTYQEKMLQQSFWGLRPLQENVRITHDKEFQEWLVKDTEQTRLFLIAQEARRILKAQEDQDFLQNCFTKIKCRKKKDVKVKETGQKVAKTPDMQFFKAEDAIITKPLEETTSGRGSAVELSLPNQDELIVADVQSSRRSSDSDIYEPNIVQMESQHNKVRKIPVVIERLSSYSKQIESDLSLQEIDGRIFLNSQQDKVLELGRIKEDRRFFKYLNDSQPGQKGKIQQVESEPVFPRRKNLSEIFEGGQADNNASGDDLEHDGLHTERPLMLATTSPVCFDDAIKEDSNLDKVTASNKLQDEIAETQKELKLTPVQIEAKFRIWLADKVQPTNRFRTLFYGLRLNSPHNAALVQPLAFMLRRILYSIIVVFMLNQAYFGVILLICTCLFFQLFVLLERPWESSIINQQHFVNEVGFLYILVHIILFNGVVSDVYDRMWIGQYVITIVCIIIIYNLIVILWHCVQIFAEMRARHQKIYKLFWQDRWCYCCKDPRPRLKLWCQRKPSNKFNEEPESFLKPDEPLVFTEIESEPVLEWFDHSEGSGTYEKPVPLSLEEEEMSSKDFFEPDDLEKKTLEVSKDIFQPDVLTPKKQFEKQNEVKQITPMSPAHKKSGESELNILSPARKTREVFQDSLLLSPILQQVYRPKIRTTSASPKEDIKSESSSSSCSQAKSGNSSSSCNQVSEKEHSHGSNCSCISDYTEEEVHYKITQKVSPGGNAIIEKIEVLNPDGPKEATQVAQIQQYLKSVKEIDIDEYADLQIKQVKDSDLTRKAKESYLLDNRFAYSTRNNSVFDISKQSGQNQFVEQGHKSPSKLELGARSSSKIVATAEANYLFIDSKSKNLKTYLSGRNNGKSWKNQTQTQLFPAQQIIPDQSLQTETDIYLGQEELVKNQAIKMRNEDFYQQALSKRSSLSYCEDAQSMGRYNNGGEQTPKLNLQGSSRVFTTRNSLNRQQPLTALALHDKASGFGLQTLRDVISQADMASQDRKSKPSSVMSINSEDSGNERGALESIFNLRRGQGSILQRTGGATLTKTAKAAIKRF